MHTFFAVAAKELRILARDRHGLLVLFLMPAVFILIMSLALRDAMDPARAAPLEYGWLDEDGGYFALALSDALAARPGLHRIGAPAPRQTVQSGAAPFAVQVPAGFAKRIAADEDVRSIDPLVTVYLAPSAPPQARELFLAQLQAALAQVRMEYLLEDSMGVPHEDAQAMRAQADPARLPLTEHYVGATGTSATAPNAVQQSVPAWLVFAMFFVVLPIAVSVLAEREQGNLQRLALMNVSPARLLLAKFPAYYLVNLAQFVLMLAVGVWLVPLCGGQRLTLGASPLGLWLIATALSMAAIGFALLLAVVARSTVQATTLGGVANLILGAIGGVMVPKMVMPPAMQQASLASPMSWALEGLWDILLRGGGVAQVLPESLALLAFGGGCYLGALWFFPRFEK